MAAQTPKPKRRRERGDDGIHWDKVNKCYQELPKAVRQAGRGEKPLQAYTVEQVAKMLHVGRDKVYYLLRTGQLRSLKIGKLRRITEQQLAEFIASLDDARAS